MMYTKLTGEIITPNDYEYNKARKNYNLAIEKEPCLIVFCLNENDVINAVKYVKENKVNFRIRSGRHDFEVNSNVNCGLIIDLSKLNYVTINEEELTATVGGGIVFGEIYDRLLDKGYTTPGGTCPDVGAAGLTTSAGVGYTTRHFGLALDNLLEVRLVNNEGLILIANENTNSDLFWALKGGLASSFGVVVSLKYKIHKVDKVSFFTSYWSEESFLDIIDTFQKIAYSTDSRLTMNMEINKDKDNKVNLVIDGQFFGLPHELAPVIEPLFKAGKIEDFELVYVPYKEAIQIWEKGCNPPNKFKNSGAFIYDDISIENLKTIIEFVKSAPTGFVHYLEWLPLGGEVVNTPKEETAFAFRDAKFLTQIKCIWNTEEERYASMQWTKLFKKFLDTIGSGNYRGFTDFDISNWQEQYYLDNYKKLQEVKDKYDGENLFKFYQSIQLTKYNTDGLTGEVITKDSPGYDNLRLDYNLYFDYFPYVIVYAENNNDVKNAIKWAKKNYMSITLRCGGHNYEAFSVSNYSLLLDVSRIRGLKLDRCKNLVTIGSGYNLGTLYSELYNLGYQFTGGTCPGVGISGLVSGGGVGLSSRLYGLACDNLVQLKLINHCGELIVANNKENSDLFWACRGAGGGNFGVFVEFTFKVRPVDKITYINITWPQDKRYEVIDQYQKLMMYADNRVTLELVVSKTTADIEGYSYASVEETKALIEPILKIDGQTETTIDYIPFIDAVKNIGKTQNPPNRFKNSAGYIYELLPQEAIDIILTNLDNTPTTGFAHSILFIPGTGKIKENKCLNTSYAHRDAIQLLQYVSRWNEGDNAEENINWIRNFRQSMLKYAYNDYVNFPDLDIINYKYQYFGKNTKALIKVKEKYNPTYLFNFPQSL